MTSGKSFPLLLEKTEEYVPARLYSPWVRYNLERAGCLYTKIGQWMASRTDLFPIELTSELQKLQTSAHPMPSSTVASVVLSSGLEFDSFDEVPVSCGSIAHVHKAVYRGEQVAVKIQRPGLIADMDRDMQYVMTVLTTMSGQESRMVTDMLKTLTELVESVRKETDFIEEGRNMTRYSDFFGASLRIPRVIVSTPSVLVMEYVPSSPYTGDASVLVLRGERVRVGEGRRARRLFGQGAILHLCINFTEYRP